MYIDIKYIRGTPANPNSKTWISERTICVMRQPTNREELMPDGSVSVMANVSPVEAAWARWDSGDATKKSVADWRLNQ